MFSTLIAFWQHEISLIRDSLEGDNKDYSLCNESENASLHLPGVWQRDSEQGDSELEKGSQILQPGMLQSEQAQNQGRSGGDHRGNQEKATLRRNFLGVRELSRQRSHSSESCTCPSCQQLLISLDDGCGICGWVPSSSVLGDKQNDSSHPLELEQLRLEQLPALEERACTHSLEFNPKPVLGETAHPLELEQQSVLGEMLTEEISNSINPLVLPSVPFSERKLLPPVRGIYLVLRQAKLIYVGQTADIHERWRSHILTPKLRTVPDIRIAWKQVLHLPLEPIEKSLIEKFQPLFNTKHVTQPKNPSGWLEHYTKNKQLKSGAIATYPSVEGERDPDNPQHWYWAYRYEEKKKSAKSDNGYITRAVSVSRVKVEAIKLAISRKWSVERILTFIRGQLNE